MLSSVFFPSKAPKEFHKCERSMKTHKICVSRPKEPQLFVISFLVHSGLISG